MQEFKKNISLILNKFLGGTPVLYCYIDEYGMTNTVECIWKILLRQADHIPVIFYRMPKPTPTQYTESNQFHLFYFNLFI
jgi:hypothetical protein